MLHIAEQFQTFRVEGACHCRLFPFAFQPRMRGVARCLKNAIPVERDACKPRSAQPVAANAAACPATRIGATVLKIGVKVAIPLPTLLENDGDPLHVGSVPQQPSEVLDTFGRTIGTDYPRLHQIIHCRLSPLVANLRRSFAELHTSTVYRRLTVVSSGRRMFIFRGFNRTPTAYMYQQGCVWLAMEGGRRGEVGREGGQFLLFPSGLLRSQSLAERCRASIGRGDTLPRRFGVGVDVGPGTGGV